MIRVIVTVIKCHVRRKPCNKEDQQFDVYKVEQYRYKIIKADR